LGSRKEEHKEEGKQIKWFHAVQKARFDNLFSAKLCYLKFFYEKKRTLLEHSHNKNGFYSTYAALHAYFNHPLTHTCMQLTADYWENRYAQQDTGWDLGAPSSPIVAYFSQIENKELRILIPGAGNAHEAEWLYKEGFINTHVLDIAHAPLQHLQARVPQFPAQQLIHADFFAFSPALPFDMIVEQTFFCAIDPSLRAQYAQKMHELLAPGGKLVGLLFNDVLNNDRPPFGGNPTEYEKYFSPFFHFKHFEACYNSIKPRSGRELFICLQKK
jgi:thiopurine S-methyltransferase